MKQSSPSKQGDEDGSSPNDGVAGTSSQHTKKSVKIGLDPKSAKIQLVVEDGDKDLLKPQILIFNAFGLENLRGNRGAHDGAVHFGSKKVFQELP